jgi:F-type H+-transporting ATPase subunit b
MPQLDFANVLTTSQVVWMALIFGALYILLSQWALPQVAGVLDERAARINTDLDTARIAKAEADAAVAELIAATKRASMEAQSAIAAAMTAAKTEAAEQARVANERLDAQLAEAEQRISAARHAAMGALRDVATETATTVVARLTGQSPDPERVGGAVDQALAMRGA